MKMIFIGRGDENMASQDDSQVNSEVQPQPQLQPQLQMPRIEDTAIVEYLDIIRREYEIERAKKQSFENRTGLVMALVGAICIFLFEKVQLTDIFLLMIDPLTFFSLVKIIMGWGVYLGFVFTIVMIIKTINVRKHSGFEVKNIDENLLGESRIVALCKIIFTYRDIILQHREMNEKRAKAFRYSLYGISSTLLFVIIYVTVI